jgi:hypothetical protein
VLNTQPFEDLAELLYRVSKHVDGVQLFGYWWDPEFLNRFLRAARENGLWVTLGGVDPGASEKELAAHPDFAAVRLKRDL